MREAQLGEGDGLPGLHDVEPRERDVGEPDAERERDAFPRFWSCRIENVDADGFRDERRKLDPAAEQGRQVDLGADPVYGDFYALIGKIDPGDGYPAGQGARRFREPQAAFGGAFGPGRSPPQAGLGADDPAERPQSGAQDEREDDGNANQQPLQNEYPTEKCKRKACVSWP